MSDRPTHTEAGESIFYPEDYGAIADGKTNCRDAVERCLADAVAAGGIVWFSGPGEYWMPPQPNLSGLDVAFLGRTLGRNDATKVVSH